MTAFPPPPAPPSGWPPAPPSQRAYSTSAIAAFVSSLLLCVPVLHAMVGFILSLVGIAATSRGARRGRGLAVAALIISLLTGAGEAGAGWIILSSATAIAGVGGRLEALLEPGGGDPSSAWDSLSAVVTEDLRASVAAKELQAWRQQVKDRYGTFVRLAEPPQDIDGYADTLRVTLLCRFTSGDVTVRLELVPALDGWRIVMPIDSAAVGEHALRGDGGGPDG
jgi:hypothetical protein